MYFNWKESEKEIFYQAAERQLEEAGIDFIGVDRRHFGIRGWNKEEKTIQAAIVMLNVCSYSSLNNKQISKLKKLENWECMDRQMQGESKHLFMHSQLIITEI